MERMVYRPHLPHMELPGLRLVSLKSPWLWLGRGLADLLQTWPVSLAFGVVLAALGYLLVTYAWTWPHLALALTSGLLLIAPFMAIVFYDLSRQIDAGGRRAGVRHALTAWRDNAWSIGLYGALLMFLVIVWERLSAIVVALFLVGERPSVENFYGMLFGSGEHLVFLIAYGLQGLLFAATVFALSVVSLPVMLDHPKSGIATALLTTVDSAGESSGHAALGCRNRCADCPGVPDVVYRAGGVLPVAGSPTWRAYQDLVEAKGTEGRSS